MQKRRVERNFLEEKLRMVGKALQQLRESRGIRDFLRTGQFSFAKMKMGVDFYVVYIDGAKYIGRSLSIDRNIKISLFDSQGSVRRKILEAIKRL